MDSEMRKHERFQSRSHLYASKLRCGLIDPIALQRVASLGDKDAQQVLSHFPEPLSHMVVMKRLLKGINIMQLDDFKEVAIQKCRKYARQSDCFDDFYWWRKVVLVLSRPDAQQDDALEDLFDYGRDLLLKHLTRSVK